MKTQASNTALQNQTTSGKRECLREKILQRIKMCNCTIKYLSRVLIQDKSTITARLSELQELGLVFGDQGRQYTIYRYVHTKKLQILRAKAYKERLLISWATRGLKKHSATMSYELKQELKKIILDDLDT